MRVTKDWLGLLLLAIGLWKGYASQKAQCAPRAGQQ